MTLPNRFPVPSAAIFNASSIRRHNKKNRAYIDNEYFEKDYARIFPHSVLVVYCLLCKHANYQTQQCFPTIDTLMKYSGIRNKNTLIEAIKYLEIFNLIKVNHHSKGRVPNNYTMIDSSQWKEIDDNKFDTVKKSLSVSKKISKQYQNQSVNGITNDTPSNISNLYKEINGENILLKEEKADKEGISPSTLSMLSQYFEKDDVLNAYNEITAKEKVCASFTQIKLLLNQWANEGKITIKVKMNW